MKACGWGTSDVLLLKLFESLAIGLLAVLGGIWLGLLYLLAGAPGVKDYLLGWSVLYPQFALPITVTPSSVFLLAAAGLLPLLCATLLPAWRVSVVEPDEAIRG